MSNFTWFWLSLSEPAANNWILYQEEPVTERIIDRPRYSQFKCPSCGKLDEDTAIRSGIDDIIFKSRIDICRSSDGVLCFSKRARCLIQEHQIYGLQFFAFPKPNKLEHQVGLPVHFTPVNSEKAGFQYERVNGQPDPNDEHVFCPVCKRPWNGAYVGPLRNSMVLPDDPLCITAPAIAREKMRGKTYWVLVSSVVREIFETERILGPDFIKL